MLHSFTGGADGAWPCAELALGSDGNFYGVAAAGGGNNAGTVFKISTAGAFEVLYSFSGGTDGAYPFGRLVQGSDGNFYGTTSAGGTNDVWYGGDGTVFKITTNGTLTTIASLGLGTAGGIEPDAGLLEASDGNFYGTTRYGGLSGQGTIFRVTTNGDLTVLVSFNGANGSQPRAELIEGSDTNVYGTAEYGGAFAKGIVFRLYLGISAPVFQPVIRSGNSILLTWSSAPSQTYQLQYRTNFAQTNWSNLGGTITATNSTVTAVDNIGPDSQRFYRVVWLK
jgi:uncharacterized repeat protein (TIGR03803 family)